MGEVTCFSIFCDNKDATGMLVKSLRKKVVIEHPELEEIMEHATHFYMALIYNSITIMFTDYENGERMNYYLCSHEYDQLDKRKVKHHYTICYEDFFVKKSKHYDAVFSGELWREEIKDMYHEKGFEGGYGLTTMIASISLFHDLEYFESIGCYSVKKDRVEINGREKTVFSIIKEGKIQHLPEIMAKLDPYDDPLAYESLDEDYEDEEAIDSWFVRY